MNLSKHFLLSEFTESETASRRGIENAPDQIHIDNLRTLCVYVLEPLRLLFGKPIWVTSGYRTKELCKAIGSKETSQHCRGEAVDFKIRGVDNMLVANRIKDTIKDFDQLILEFYKPMISPNSGWIHCSYVDIMANRHSVISTGNKGYVNGLQVHI